MQFARMAFLAASLSIVASAAASAQGDPRWSDSFDHHSQGDLDGQGSWQYSGGSFDTHVQVIFPPANERFSADQAILVTADNKAMVAFADDGVVFADNQPIRASFRAYVTKKAARSKQSAVVGFISRGGTDPANVKVGCTVSINMNNGDNPDLVNLNLDQSTGTTIPEKQLFRVSVRIDPRPGQGNKAVELWVDGQYCGSSTWTGDPSLGRVDGIALFAGAQTTDVHIDELVVEPDHGALFSECDVDPDISSSASSLEVRVHADDHLANGSSSVSLAMLVTVLDGKDLMGMRFPVRILHNMPIDSSTGMLAWKEPIAPGLLSGHEIGVRIVLVDPPKLGVSYTDTAYWRFH